MARLVSRYSRCSTHKSNNAVKNNDMRTVQDQGRGRGGTSTVSTASAGRMRNLLFCGIKEFVLNVYNDLCD